MKTKRKLLLLISVSIFAIFQLHAQTPGFEWAKRIGGDTTLISNSLTIDPSGNQIMVGTFRGTVDFDPGPDPEDTCIITSNGFDDIFILKLDMNGNFMWAAGMGDVGYDRGSQVTTDAYGNIYMTGYFIYSMDADPSALVFMLTQTKQTAFVSKIYPSGDLAWAKQMGFPGDWGLAYGYSIYLDNQNNVITAGTFTGRVDFDPGAGTFNLSSTGGSNDAYIQKLTNGGEFIWAKQIAGSYSEHISAITTDNQNNIYTSGSFYGTADFNPDRKLKYLLTPAGSSDVFYQKLTENGEFVWAKKVGGISGDFGYVLHYDPVGSGALYSTGQFYGDGDFDPGPEELIFPLAGGCDLFLVKLNLSGNLIWAKHIGGPDWDSGTDITTDPDGNVYMCGFFYGTTDFNPDPVSDYFMTANGANDLYLYKSDINGNFLWAEHLGGTEYDFGIGLELDPYGDILVAGGFQSTMDFDPDGDDSFDMTATGTGRDLFVLKLSPSGGEGCVIPINLVATPLTITAELNWGAVDGATGYYIRYRIMGTTDWILVPDMISGTSVNITDLVPATFYEFQVKTDCQSNFSYSGEFTTLGTGCIDQYEPNNSMATAVQIQAGNDIFGLIDIISDVDWFKINTNNAAKNLKITLFDLPADYNIRLVNGAGTVLGSSYNTGTTPETIIYNCKQAGLYYIHIFGSSGAFNPNDCYTLHVDVSSTQYAKSEVAEISFDEESGELTLYPNPARDVLNLDYNSKAAGTVNCTLISISGQVILEQEFSAGEGQNHHTLNLEGVANGLYMIKLTRDGESTLSKFMVNR